MGKKLDVKLENKFCYNICIEENWSFLDKYLIEIYPNIDRKICIVTDSNVSPLYLGDVYSILSNKFNDVITFEWPAGEAQKTLKNIERLYDVLISKNFHRSDILVALGGGVVGDMTGFTAATFLRGIDFIQIPTTLLSQVDSSIGGKTGVDYLQYKNMVGAFHMPKMVYINTKVLDTLPDEQFSSGMGEVIKHGLIQNKEYYDWILAHHDAIMNKQTEALTHMIFESCKIKRGVVEKDPKEQGLRAILNFGHTIGHAIEKCSNYALFHGHCVALGMLSALYLSLKKGFLDEKTVEAAKNTLACFGLLTNVSDMDVKDILSATMSDKKRVGSKVKFILLKDIGDAYIDMDVTEDMLKKAIESVVL